MLSFSSRFGCAQAALRNLWIVLLHSQVLHEAPVAAGINLNVLHILLGDDHVRLVPKREYRRFTTHDLLYALVKLLRFFAVKSIDCLGD